LFKTYFRNNFNVVAKSTEIGGVDEHLGEERGHAVQLGEAHPAVSVEVSQPL